jgi:xylose isomerase
MIEAGTLSGPRAERYSGWSADLGTGILIGSESLETLEAKVMSGEIDPTPVSGSQELLENRVNMAIWSSGS